MVVYNMQCGLSIHLLSFHYIGCSLAAIHSSHTAVVWRMLKLHPMIPTQLKTDCDVNIGIIDYHYCHRLFCVQFCCGNNSSHPAAVWRMLKLHPNTTQDEL
jgi:hypothetical protein